MTFKRIFLVLLLLVALPVLYFVAALNWSYSDGERAGWVQKVSRKGWVCKTWEGELALVSQPGAALEKFYFTIWDKSVAADLNRYIGKRVSLHYEEKVGLPTTCFGDTRYYVTKVTAVDDISLSPGVVVHGTRAHRCLALPRQLPPRPERGGQLASFSQPAAQSIFSEPRARASCSVPAPAWSRSRSPDPSGCRARASP